MDREQSVQHFLDLLKKSRRGNFKIYIGMIAGVGKSYRMLSDAHQLLESGIDVKIGYIETHGRVETEALVEGLPIIPRRKIFYKGKEIEEMDLQSILSIHPEVVIVDELAHTNVEGSKNEKRWQDVMDILDAGISVITAVNIQHIEGLNEMVQDVVGIEVKERIPDIVLEQADEVVNIDLTADELLARLKAGKIYKPDKIQTALNNFFKAEHILQLRELALKEVALRVEKKWRIPFQRISVYATKGLWPASAVMRKLPVRSYGKSHGWQPDIIPSFLYCMYKPQEKVPTGFRWQVKGICLTISSWQRNLEEKSFKCNPHI